MLVKTIKEDDGTIKEVARFGLFEPIGKGLSQEKDNLYKESLII